MGNVRQIDIEGGQNLGSIQVDDNPVAIAMHTNGKYAYVANSDSNSASILV